MKSPYTPPSTSSSQPQSPFQLTFSKDQFSSGLPVEQSSALKRPKVVPDSSAPDTPLTSRDATPSLPPIPSYYMSDESTKATSLIESQAHSQNAAKHISAGDYSSALVSFEELLKLPPQYINELSNVYNYKALCHFHLGQYQLALDCLNKVLQDFSIHGILKQLFYHMAICYCKLDDLPAAEMYTLIYICEGLKYKQIFESPNYPQAIELYKHILAGILLPLSTDEEKQDHLNKHAIPLMGTITRSGSTSPLIHGLSLHIASLLNDTLHPS